MALPTQLGPVEHVVIFGIDGMGAEYFVRETEKDVLFASNLRRLQREGLFTANCRSVFPTLSTPNWYALMRSATPTEGGAATNGWDRSNAHVSDTNNPDGHGCSPIPDIFTVVRAQDPSATTALFHNWGMLAQSVAGHPSNRNVSRFVSDSQGNALEDGVLVKEAGEYFAQNKPKVLFLHLNDVDEAGHKKGYGDFYNEKVQAVDRALGSFLEKIETSGVKNRTLLFVVSDHGREDSGYSHGNFAQNQVKAPLFVWGDPIPIAIRGRKIETPILNIDVPATAVHSLGLKTPIQWRGRPIIELSGMQDYWVYKQPPDQIPGNCAAWKLNHNPFLIPYHYVTGLWNGAIFAIAILWLITHFLFGACWFWGRNGKRSTPSESRRRRSSVSRPSLIPDENGNDYVLSSNGIEESEYMLMTSLGEGGKHVTEVARCCGRVWNLRYPPWVFVVGGMYLLVGVCASVMAIKHVAWVLRVVDSM